MTEPTKQVMMTKLEMLRSRVLTRMHEARCPMYPDPCVNDDCGNEAEMLSEFERAVRSKALKECESSWDHGHETGFHAGRAAAREEVKHPTCGSCRFWSDEADDFGICSHYGPTDRKFYCATHPDAPGSKEASDD